MMSMFLSQASLVQALLTFVLIGLFAVMVIQSIAYVSRFAGHALSGVSASMMSPLGAVFGLTAAFLGALVWQNHGDAVVAANLEARSLSEAWTTASYLPAPLRTQVQHGIEDYVHAVVTDEWPIMTTVTSLNNPVSERTRQHLLDAIRKLVADDRVPSPAMTATGRELRAAFEARSRRMDIALHRISNVQLCSALALGLLLIMLVALVHHSSRQAQIIGVVLASFAVAITIASIVVHDDPFSGYLAVTASDFAHTAEYGTAAVIGR